LAIPIAYSIAIYVLAWSLGLAVFRAPSRNLLIAFIPGLIPYCIAALGEEIGWRGLLVPSLIRTTSFARTVTISWIAGHFGTSRQYSGRTITVGLPDGLTL
jgi:membrane protease YdiL (CAAX protease family)